MTKRGVAFAILAMGLILAATVAWAGDGDNIFEYAYGNAVDDTLSDSLIRGVAAGSDLDQDGLYEIIVTDHDGGRVHVYEVVGDDSLEWVWTSASAIGTWYNRQVYTGDMDNDGIGEIIFVPGDGTWSATYQGGIHVYEWDGITDNGYGTAPLSIYKPNPAHQERFRTEGFAVGDVDGDGVNEMVVCDNTTSPAQDGLYILSVIGDFTNPFHTWVEEGKYLRSGPNPFGGSPTNAGIGDMDGDGNYEAIFGVWDYAALYIVEATGADAYEYQTYIQIDTTGDGVNLDNFVVADLNNDGADEIYMNIWGGGEMACVTGGTDVSAITFAENVTYIAQTGEAGWAGMALGDQDHGPGTDGVDLYVAAYTNGVIQDWELTGADPTDPAAWTPYDLFVGTSSDQGSFGLSVPPVDLDGDGRLELVASFQEVVTPAGKWFRVFEWAGELVPVELSSFTASAGQEMVELSWRVENEVENLGFNLYRDGEKITFVESNGPSDAPRTYTWIDKDVIAGVMYTYWIADVSLDGTVSMHDFVAKATPTAASGVPSTYWLSQNYPNPFNANTQIRYQIPEDSPVTIIIFNTLGQEVRGLVNAEHKAGEYEVIWDGRDTNGQEVATGIYFCTIKAGEFTQTRKMVLLK